MSTTAHDINCPNCGAPTEVPPYGNTIECQYCGTRVYLPQSVLAQPQAPERLLNPGWDEQQKKRMVRWVWTILGIILAVMVVPPLCTLVFTFCFSFIAVFADLLR